MFATRPIARRLSLTLVHRSPLLPSVPRPTHLPSLSTLPARPFSTTHISRDTHAPSNSAARDPRWRNGEKVTYDELKPVTQMPSDDVLIVDVREPSEVALGSIPSSVNLPLSVFEKAMSLDEGDFVKEFGWRKPGKSQPIVFYCRAGARAQTALDLAKHKGYKYLRNYQGSWLDWEKREKESNPHGDD
ncbi:hypothetical protein NBRC10512_007131 [Rhodotorula toruloides]|uniref:RHTO0S16e04808g1_1 n=2 Tax=Rhodotorula toruloides TaxID=5286 RepID=A0A061BMF1_RHOTO|nr:endoplasmic reticulum protein [Rhodotorula toruloides NP11]EMS18315.1 endoplasmic reticulum protein [Rhodotorula toruloides NP11]CDR48263.1 RHTO0S16e04808g1_1 [Rhodotorula toruloides]